MNAGLGVGGGRGGWVTGDGRGSKGEAESVESTVDAPSLGAPFAPRLWTHPSHIIIFCRDIPKMQRSTSRARLASHSRQSEMEELFFSEEANVPAWARSGRTASSCDTVGLASDDSLDYEEDDSYVDEAVGRAERAYSSRFWVFYRKRNVGFGFVYVSLSGKARK